MCQWILPTLSEILAASDAYLASDRGRVGFSSISAENAQIAQIKAEQQWCVAIAALEQLLLQFNHDAMADCAAAPGVVLAGPVPVISHTELIRKLPAWTFTANFPQLGMHFQLPPAAITTAVAQTGTVLPLVAGDPLNQEQFCLVLSAHFGLVMVVGDVNGVPTFSFSFEPDVVEQAWRSLRARVALTSPEFLATQLDAAVAKFPAVAPDYRIVMQFSRLLLEHLPSPQQENAQKTYVDCESHTVQRSDVELLQAFAHEVRTPLTTIRTMTRLLMKRRDLATEAVKRLEIIDHECTEQIDRMELLFRAAELETKAKQTNAYLTTMSLAQVLQQSIPRWQKQATRRNLTLDVVLPQQLPTVVSDPKMLDQVLTGLIENFTRSLPAGSHIQVQVIPAGDQLKLQLLPTSQSNHDNMAEAIPPIRKSLGQLLTFQPETGNISLNITATKQLFQAIGGKLIVRQRPHEGEVLTIFLPLDGKQTEYCG